MQLVISPEGDELAFDFDEAMAELNRALPKDHPLLNRVGGLFEAAGEWLGTFETVLAEERSTPWRAQLAAAVEMIDDWKRGIRDWSEVEEALSISRSWLEAR